MKFIKTLPINLIFGGILVLRQEPMCEYMEHIILKMLLLCVSCWFEVCMCGCRGVREMYQEESKSLQQCLKYFILVHLFAINIIGGPSQGH